jgi:hypothetical protein
MKVVSERDLSLLILSRYVTLASIRLDIHLNRARVRVGQYSLHDIFVW